MAVILCSYYKYLRSIYENKRDYMLRSLEAAGLPCIKPQGAFFIMADTSALSFPNTPPAAVTDCIAAGKLQVAACRRCWRCCLTAKRCMVDGVMVVAAD